VGAEEAQRVGLVNTVTETETLLQETEALVFEILAQAPVAVRKTWEALHRGLNLSE
jgi:enoyl-CoA hydratase